MTPEEKDKVISCAKRYMPALQDGDDSEFENYGLDSISAISLIIDIETLFGFEFDDDDLIFSKFNTLEKLLDIVEKNRTR